MGRHKKIPRRRVEVTSVFDKIIASKALLVSCRGSARSSKSYSIGQLIVQKFTKEENKTFLVTRKTMPSLRITAYKLILTLLQDYGYYPYSNHNKAGNTIHYGSNFMLFSGIDDIEKIKSSEWNYIWMEEATDFAHNDFQILKMRMSGPTIKDEPNQIFLSYNPINAFHWIKTEVIEKESDCDDIISTYKDNPFLSAEYVKILEELKGQDSNLWRIYGLGEWGVLEHVIYSNWNIIREKDWPSDFDEIIYGLDFGFNNPSALIELGFLDKEVYEKELIYESGLTNSQLIELTKNYVKNKNAFIYADCAEPARIEEFAQADFNIHPADKSVKDGIDCVKTHKIHVHEESPSLIKEKRGYKYKVNKDGTVLDEPVKFLDHLCFIDNTKITTIKGLIDISDIKIGDQVLTRKGYRDVINTTSRTAEVKDYNLNRRILSSTEDHPVWTQEKGFVKISSLTHNDMLCMVNQNIVPSLVQGKIIGKNKRIAKVYNITVKGEHEYFANEILVGNCDGERYALYTHSKKVLPGFFFGGGN